MNSDEVNWLLQTIEDPQNAKRFAQAQYQRGRIPYHVMASLARDRNWTDWPGEGLGWPLNSDAWDGQMMFLAQRRIAASGSNGADMRLMNPVTPVMTSVDSRGSHF